MCLMQELFNVLKIVSIGVLGLLAATYIILPIGIMLMFYITTLAGG